VSGFEFTGWFALLVPAGTPQRIVRWLNAELGATLGLPETRSRLAAIGVQPVTSTPGEVFEQITRDTERWRRVIRTANITFDVTESAQ
jgi:tripartite-type tricarboxylate transporter receptor subunit TctC